MQKKNSENTKNEISNWEELKKTKFSGQIQK